MVVILSSSLLLLLLLFFLLLLPPSLLRIHQSITGPRPLPRVAPTLSSINSHLYLFGGRQGVEMGEGALDELWRVDTTGLLMGSSGSGVQWEKVVAKNDPPRARSFHQMVR